MIGTNAETQTINRNDLIEDIKNHDATEDEKAFIPRFLDLLKSDRCFYRDHFEPGHITASALLLNKAGDKILMNHHKSLNRWLAFGGHCDGQEDTLNVAIRETMEESGLTAFKPITASIVDIDIHTIPANAKRGEPEHDHYDISYVMQMTGDQQPVLSDESVKLQWMTFEEALATVDDESNMSRLIEKAKTLTQ